MDVKYLTLYYSICVVCLHVWYVCALVHVCCACKYCIADREKEIKMKKNIEHVAISSTVLPRAPGSIGLRLRVFNCLCMRVRERLCGIGLAFSPRLIINLTATSPQPSSRASAGLVNDLACAPADVSQLGIGAWNVAVPTGPSSQPVRACVRARAKGQWHESARRGGQEGSTSFMKMGA
ncbi:hypothetical protein BJ166DRAFT_232393 [Pestalotiopsis sp. NC0098]|nr:hypothetical protein BJ166DRAFT_232393 [Pestalotiopsis sp. NC0098]